MNYDSRLMTAKTFHVDDPAAFTAELDKLGILEGCGDTGLSFERQKDGSFWMGGFNAELESYYVSDIDEEVDLVPVIQKHLRADQTAVFTHNGNEGLRYLTGYVLVVTKHTHLGQNIDDLASSLEKRAVRAEKRKIKRLFGKAEIRPINAKKGEGATDAGQTREVRAEANKKGLGE